MLRRSLVLALLVGLAWMTNTEPVSADPSQCAEFISGGGVNSSSPMSGTLLGQKKVTKTTSWGGGWSPYSFKTEIGASTTEEYYVGIYALVGGGTIEVNCASYRYI